MKLIKAVFLIPVIVLSIGTVPAYASTPDIIMVSEDSDNDDNTQNGRESDMIFEDPEDGAFIDSDGSITTDWYCFSPEEVAILAQVMLHEAGAQCEEGRIAIVEVILNRMKSEYFSPDSVEGIVYAPGQFSNVEESMDLVPSDEDLCLVQDIIIGNKRVLGDMDILYFRNTMLTDGFPTSTAADWGKHRYATFIQDHAFYAIH